MSIPVGMRGHAPSVLVQPIKRVPVTAAELIEALKGLPSDARILLVEGALNKVQLVVGNLLEAPHAVLYHISDEGN